MTVLTPAVIGSFRWDGREHRPRPRVGPQGGAACRIEIVPVRAREFAAGQTPAPFVKGRRRFSQADRP